MTCGLIDKLKILNKFQIIAIKFGAQWHADSLTNENVDKFQIIVINLSSMTCGFVDNPNCCNKFTIFWIKFDFNDMRIHWQMKMLQ